MGSYGFAEIVKGKPGPYLLDNKFRFFAVETGKCNGIFQFPESSFNALCENSYKALKYMVNNSSTFNYLSL